MHRLSLIFLLVSSLSLGLAVYTPDASAQSQARKKRKRLSPGPRYCPPKKRLKKGRKSNLKVYAIGSSTMGNVLGAQLQKALKKEGVRMKYWGKASTGLARPDYHDWIEKAPGLMKKNKPDIVIVSLGTNDGQHLNAGKYKWIKFKDKKWGKEYANRVDKLLSLLAGKKRQRTVVWLGPTALPQERSAERMDRIRKIIRSRIRKFKGRAIFVDGIAQTTDSKGKIKQRISIPGRKSPVRARAKDNIHLTVHGVRWLLADPTLKRVRRCLK